MTSERRYLRLPPWRAVRPFGRLLGSREPSWFMAPPQAVLQASGPSRGSATAQPWGQHCSLRTDPAAWECCCEPSAHGPPAHCRDLWQPFPVRDLGSGEAGFLLRHCDVTTRVGTRPRKTSSWIGSTLVQNTGSERSAFPCDIRASVTPSRGAPLATALPGSVLLHSWDFRAKNWPIAGSFYVPS